MTATDELRRLLYERGEYYKTSGNRTWWGRPIDMQTGKPINVFHYQAQPMGEDRLFVELQLATPEQAIAATLGVGTCEADETDVIKCWVKCEDKPSTERMELIHVMECSVCGGTYEHVNGSYEFCPRCGRRIEVDE